MENIAKDSQIDYSAAFTRSENHKRCAGLLSVYIRTVRKQTKITTFIYLNCFYQYYANDKTTHLSSISSNVNRTV